MQEPLPHAAVCTGEHTCGPAGLAPWTRPAGRVGVFSLQLMDKAAEAPFRRICLCVSAPPSAGRPSLTVPGGGLCLSQKLCTCGNGACSCVIVGVSTPLVDGLLMRAVVSEQFLYVYPAPFLVRCIPRCGCRAAAEASSFVPGQTALASNRDQDAVILSETNPTS